MSRTPPPPWVRWQAQDGIAACMQLSREIDKLINGLLDGDRLDQTLKKIRGVEKEVIALRNELQKLQTGIDVADLIEWIRSDNDLRLMVQTLLEKEL